MVDKNKVKRARKRNRKVNLKTHRNALAFEELKAFYFDGRKDKTRMYVDGQVLFKKEEHISILKQPGSEYICHVAVTSKGSTGMLEAIITGLQNLSIKYAHVYAVGCDGTNANTGPMGGAIKLLETHLGKPVHWFVCLLHANELPLRHLIIKMDGDTTGPNAWKGPIGQAITKDVWKKEIVQFEKIEFKCDIDNIDSVSASYSADQKYLFNMCKAISTGHVSESLAKQTIDEVSHSRWHTTGGRVLREYVSNPKPSAVLRVLAEYIVKVYAVMHFNIKANSCCTYGARHVANLIKLSRFLPKKALKIIDPIIMRNGYFAHSENVILTMLDDEREWIRQLGYMRVLHAREHNENDPDNVRKFEVPQMYTDFESYENMINWNETFFEPPILRNVEINHDNYGELAQKKITEHEFGCDLLNIPCHTQAVERCVQLVARAAKNVCDEDAREGFVLTTLKSRKNMSEFRHKSQYNANESANLPLKV